MSFHTFEAFYMSFNSIRIFWTNIMVTSVRRHLFSPVVKLRHKPNLGSLHTAPHSPSKHSDAKCALVRLFLLHFLCPAFQLIIIIIYSHYRSQNIKTKEMFSIKRSSVLFSLCVSLIIWISYVVNFPEDCW